MEEEKAEIEVRAQAMIRDYQRRYGFAKLTIAQANEICRAELELAECKGCVGLPCQKQCHKYKIPLTECWDLKGSIPFVACKWKGEVLKEKSLQNGLPLKYLEKSFADYKTDAENERAVKIAKWFITKKPAKSLYLYGGTGCGKTFLSALIAKEFCNVIFGDVPTLLGKIKQTFNGNGDSQEIISRYCNCDLLILDDLGAGQITEWSADILYQIINNRYNTVKPIIITSNFDLEDLQNRLSVKNKEGKTIDTYSAARITSRISEFCVQAFLGINDRRLKS